MKCKNIYLYIDENEINNITNTFVYLVPKSRMKKKVILKHGCHFLFNQFILYYSEKHFYF